LQSAVPPVARPRCWVGLGAVRPGWQPATVNSSSNGPGCREAASLCSGWVDGVWTTNNRRPVCSSCSHYRGWRPDWDCPSPRATGSTPNQSCTATPYGRCPCEFVHRFRPCSPSVLGYGAACATLMANPVKTKDWVIDDNTDWPPRGYPSPPLSPTLYSSLTACGLRAAFGCSSTSHYPRRSTPAARIGTAFHETME